MTTEYLVIYWTSNLYSFGKWIRIYGFYPDFLPICIYSDHGAGYKILGPALHELESDAPCQFYHSYRNVIQWKSQSKKPCYTLFSPFVFCRRQLNINRSANAKGTLFFVAHSTTTVKDQNSIESYLETIKKIPNEFSPITICLHMHDINLGLKEIYEVNGYRVVSAGDTLDINFAKNFYNLVKNYRYTMSNLLGSYAYYSVEMGIPFSLIGQEPTYYNFGDENLKPGPHISFLNDPNYTNAKNIFTGYKSKITIEMQNFAYEGLGIYYGLSRISMSFVLYKSFLIWLLRKGNFILLIKYELRIIKKIINQLINVKKIFQ